mgnify:CR=1 FL=1
MSATSKVPNHRTIGLLLLGGEHHILHLIPIASELELQANTDVVIFVTTEQEKEVCRNVLIALGARHTKINVLKTKFFVRLIYPKRSLALYNLKIWKSLDALIVAERTSTVLRYVSRRLPLFIHIPHGAGDGAKSYDSRIRHFDHVIVAGEKDKKRMIDLGLTRDETCHVTGYIKPYAVNCIQPIVPTIFENMKPTVLYNPHFNEDLSSWRGFGHDLLTAFSKSKDMNFIVAPHIKLFKNKLEDERKQIEAFSKFDNIHVDLGSSKSCDMSYTRCADIYIGDVSSQVYEFLSEPKPCIFITDQETQWQDNPDYAHWSYGPVCHSVEDVMQELERASKGMPNYAQVQSQGCLAAKGHPSWNPIKRAANVVAAILN